VECQVDSRLVWLGEGLSVPAEKYKAWWMSYGSECVEVKDDELSRRSVSVCRGEGKVTLIEVYWGRSEQEE
jgi:uncharacterized membrane protein